MSSFAWDNLKKEARSQNQAKASSARETEKSLEALSKQVDKKQSEREHKTRSWLTTGFILGLFLLIILAALYVPLHNSIVYDMIATAHKNSVPLPKDIPDFISFESIFSLIFNSLGTSLGFIIGYYFKEKSSK